MQMQGRRSSWGKLEAGCVQSQTPVLKLRSENLLTECLRKSCGCMGSLDTNRLDAVTLNDLHQSIQVTTDTYLSQAMNTYMTVGSPTLGRNNTLAALAEATREVEVDYDDDDC